MGWADWPYWVKGAIVGFLFGWGSFVVTFNCTQLVQSSSCNPLEAAVWPLNIFVGIAFSLLGAITGLVIGKIKSRMK